MEKKVCSEMNTDRISALPEPLQQHILSFLWTIDAIRTSILSKSWRMVWTGLTRFDLNGDYNSMMLTKIDMIPGNKDNASRARKESYVRKVKMFHDFLDRVFGVITKVEELKLYLPGLGSELEIPMDRWLNCAIEFNVKKLDVTVGKWGAPRHILPKSVLSSKSITNLRLDKCEINLLSLSNTQLPALRELYLRCVYLDEVVMESVLAKCLNLERFTLIACPGLTTLNVIGHTKLREVCVMLELDNLEVIKIDALNLLDFSYVFEGYFDGELCKIDLLGCKNLKRLDLSGSQLEDYDLKAYLENFHLLEDLMLTKCHYLEHVEISSQRLIHLGFDKCRDLVKVKLDTPNLKTFYFSGFYHIFFVPKRSLKLRTAAVYLQYTLQIEKEYVGFIKFLAKLGQCENLYLDLDNVKDVIIPENVRMKSRPPLYGVKHLQVDASFSSLLEHTSIALIESLLWLAPCPESLSINNSYNSKPYKLLKFKYESPSNTKKKCGCWKSVPVNCWRHSVTEVVLETQEGDEIYDSEECFFPKDEVLLANKGEDEDDTKLADFFQNARTDGKIVSFVKGVRPKDIYD